MEKKDKLVYKILDMLKWAGIMLVFTAWPLIVSIIRSAFGI